MKILSICLFYFIATSAFAGPKIKHSAWKKSFEKDGISIFSQKIKGYDIIAFKATSSFETHISKLLTILRDAERSKEWSDNLKEVRYIDEPNDLSSILYEVRRFPWPFKNRDLVTSYKLSINEKRKSLIVNFQSVADSRAPENDDFVRAKLHYGSMEFWPKKDGTYIELIMMGDPKGSIPKWIVNFFQESVPFEYIKELKKQAAKETRPMLPGIKAIINKFFQKFPIN